MIKLIMETINKDDLLPWLKKSRLAEQFEDEIVVPEKYVFTKFRIKYEIAIENNNDFNEVMDQLRFYMVNELPHEIYEYVHKEKPDLSNFKDL